MERNAHYALVGAVSAALLFGLLIFVVWLARVQFAAEYAVYDVDFNGPVRGLSSGGEVYFNGIKVGEVTKLSLDRRDPNRVVARIRTGADAPVKTDSYATLEPQGVTGVNYIQITAGAPDSPLLRDVTPADRIPVIPTRRGALESILEGGGDVLARSVEALDRVNRLLSDRNLQAFSQTLANVRDASGLVKDQRKLLADLDTTLTSVTATSAHIDQLAQSTDRIVNGPARKTLAELGASADSLRATSSDARALLAKLQGPTGDFAANGLPQLTRAVASLQSTAESLDRLVGAAEQNPRSLLTKPPARTREVPQ